MQEILNDRAQTLFRKALGKYLATDTWDTPETRAYVASERALDEVLYMDGQHTLTDEEIEARWAKAKAEVDDAMTNDHEWHEAAGQFIPRLCDSCAEMQEQPMPGQMPEGEARADWGNR